MDDMDQRFEDLFDFFVYPGPESPVSREYAIARASWDERGRLAERDLADAAFAVEVTVASPVAARDEILEEAARVCDLIAERQGGDAGCADAIRDLKLDPHHLEN